MEKRKYFRLIRKSDNKEVYSSPDKDDKKIVVKNLKFYFDRINSGIQQQMQSPKLTQEQKDNLKLFDYSDYLIQYAEEKELGCCFQKIFFTVAAEHFLKE